MMDNENDCIFEENEISSFGAHYISMEEQPKDLNPNHQLPNLDKPIDPENINHSELPKLQNQSSILSFFGQGEGNIPEWMGRYKMIPGLTGIITLADPQVVDEMKSSELDKIDIEHLVDENNNYNLNKFFEESERKDSSNRNFTGSSRKNSSNVKNLGSMKKQAFKNNNKPEPKISFFKDYLTNMFDSHILEIAHNGGGKFVEFEGTNDLTQNLDNFLYLEEHKDVYENEFEQIYLNSYHLLISKLKSTLQNYAITHENVVKVIYEHYCSSLYDLFAYLKKCNNDYCLNLLKNKTHAQKQKIQLEHLNQSNSFNKSQNASPMNVNSQTIHGNFLNQNLNQKPLSMPSQNQLLGPALTNNLLPKVQQHNTIPASKPTGLSNSSISVLAQLIDGEKFSVVEEKKAQLGSNGNGYGQQNEEHDIADYSSYHRSSDVSIMSDFESTQSERQNDVSRRNGTNQPQAQRKYWSEMELQELENLYSQYYPNNIPTDKLEDFARRCNRTLCSVQTKCQKLKKTIQKRKEELALESLNQKTAALPSQNFASNTQANTKKGDIPLEKMIKTVLTHFPNQTATKKDIVARVREIFFPGNSAPNETWLNSVTQTLSTSRQFNKLKGTYSLKSNQFVNSDINQARTLKGKLIFILSILPERAGDINTIRKLYQDYFKDAVALDRDKTWESSIIKTLKQNSEFDSSNCKAKYCMNADFLS